VPRSRSCGHSVGIGFLYAVFDFAVLSATFPYSWGMIVFALAAQAARGGRAATSCWR
jgi:hypothetical protein